MEKRVIIGLVAGVMALSVLSCAKEQQKDNLPENPNGLITEVLSATKEGDATKVTMNSSRQFGWSTSDQVAFTIDKKDGTYYFKDSDYYGQTEDYKFTVSYPETHTRTGYAVIPSTFAGSYDGFTLTVTYPDNYDISDDVEPAEGDPCYDNADGGHFIPFPMVSKSDPKSAKLTFYSIGAMAKVTVSDVPAGTKNLYITFNKPVTGTFPVTGLDTFDDPDPAPQVSCSGDVNATITVKISESGLASQQTITLYIPIPVCDAGLQVISSFTTPPKAALARNHGYAFATSAISSHNSNKSYFTLGGGLYELAPGNLSNTNGVSGEWSFLPNQVMTQLSKHTVNPGSNERDVFTFNELKSVLNPDETPASYPYTLSGTLSVGDHDDWKLMSSNLAVAFIDNNTSTGMVGSTSGAHYARINVDVSDSEMSGYGLLNDSFNYSGNKYVYGMIFFPNSYFDLTDLIAEDINGAQGNNTRSTKSVVSYSDFASMVAAGAIFLPATGRHSSSWGSVGTGIHYGLGTRIESNPYYLNLINTSDPGFVRQAYDYAYYPVRLIRSVPPELGDNGVSQGDNWSWD